MTDIEQTKKGRTMDKIELEWPERLILRDTKVFADEGQRIFTTATGYGYEEQEYVRADLAASTSEPVAVKALDTDIVRELQLLMESFCAYGGDAVPASIIEKARTLHAKLSALTTPPAAPTAIDVAIGALTRIAEHPDTENGGFRAAIAREALASLKTQETA